MRFQVNLLCCIDQLNAPSHLFTLTGVQDIDKVGFLKESVASGGTMSRES